jgi:hypothetical protein
MPALRLGLALLAASCSFAQRPSAGLEVKVEAIVAKAYESALVGLPCKVKTRGKAKMLRWEDVDRCLNEAESRVDWESLRGEIERLGGSANEAASLADASMAARALAYDKLFVVRSEQAHLPLTNSVLKFLPADSLANLPVVDRDGKQVGTFLGTYSYERAGGLASANTYRLTLFQYSDLNGNLQSAPDKLLLDAYGVPWKEAAAQRGFRLRIERLFPPPKR